MAVIAGTIRPIQDGERLPILKLARTLDKWFNEPGLAQMGLDLPSHRGFVAVHEHEVLGFVTWTAIDPAVANLSWMGVAEDAHGRGIGRSLLEALIVELRAAGYRVLEVSTVADSLDYEPYARTRAFYRAMGFLDHRVDRMYYGEGTHRYDRLVMRLDLRAGGLTA